MLRDNYKLKFHNPIYLIRNSVEVSLRFLQMMKCWYPRSRRGPTCDRASGRRRGGKGKGKGKGEEEGQKGEGKRSTHAKCTNAVLSSMARVQTRMEKELGQAIRNEL